jgi:hypothetical protein
MSVEPTQLIEELVHYLEADHDRKKPVAPVP